MRAATPYLEAMRYVNNARKTLSSSAGKDGKYYTDAKYVKMASHTAYTGVLLALKYYFGLKTNHKKRDNVEVFKRAMASENHSKQRAFKVVYDTLHLSGGYDGNLSVDVIQAGLHSAEELIEWTRSKTDKMKL